MYQAQENRYDDIEYRRSGNSGLVLPPVSLGLWHNFGGSSLLENMREMLRTAFDHGIIHFDLANNYGPPAGSAETNFGQIFKEDFMPYRDELIISSKAGYEMWPGPYGDFGSRKYMMASLDQSLKRTGLEYFDIFYHHRMDPHTPLEESMQALADMVKQGKALYVGISNYDRETSLKAMEIMKTLQVPLVINQSPYNIFNRRIENDGLTTLNQEKKLGLITFSPLAQGLLTDRYLDGIPEDSRVVKDGRFLNESSVNERLEQIKALREIANNRGQSLAQMALSWILHDNKATSVLIGASKKEQILDNLQACKNTEFTKKELEKIDSISISQ